MFQLLLEPVDCRMTQLVFSSVAHCIASADKFEVMAGKSPVCCVSVLVAVLESTQAALHQRYLILSGD